MRRGEIWWADLGPARGSEPAKRRPVLIVQADPFTASHIATVIAAVITSNLRLADAPGNVRLSKRASKLGKPSVVNVSQVVTLNKTALTEPVATLPTEVTLEVDAGLRLVLGL
ncbi:mRNA interferase MazF6 [bacterium BMS3Abin02]|nr:mRNA interferase MazF6 [bacterium BMS3Abin02]GBE23374.1 mRNA interferase MazF6 [bacterium BMS3Bbin01]HDH27474.1 type II toxin-antitoxin system PemK/MazF family toxin [Actinomycetota bacterium]HDK45193.1 type II toxin-antitoxin system PemK/MazF family toxin [Actinomycetota bacterium]